MDSKYEGENVEFILDSKVRDFGYDYIVSLSNIPVKLNLIQGSIREVSDFSFEKIPYLSQIFIIHLKNETSEAITQPLPNGDVVNGDGSVVNIESNLDAITVHPNSVLEMNIVMWATNSASLIAVTY